MLWRQKMKPEMRYKCHCSVSVQHLRSIFPVERLIPRRICYYLQTARCYWLTRSFQVFLRKSIRLRSSTWKKRQWKAAKHDRLRSSLPHRMSRWWLWKSKGNGCYAHIVTGKPVCGCEEILFFGIIFFSVQSASRKHSLIYDNFI